MALPNDHPTPAQDAADTSVTVFAPADRVSIRGEHGRLDCRALMDDCLSAANWYTIFNRLLANESVAASSLLLRFRFGQVHPDSVNDRYRALNTVVNAPEEEETTYDLESTCGTTAEVL